MYPEFRHFKQDTYLRTLFEPLGLQYYRDDVVIEHMHVTQHKAPMDANYEWGYSPEEMTYGGVILNKWMDMYAKRDRDLMQKVVDEKKVEKKVIDEKG